MLLHTHHHGHDHGNDRGIFALAIGLNLAFVAIEIAYGLFANSIALIADAGHNLGDTLGLAAAALASMLATRLPSPTHTYGWRRGTILAALTNSALLLVAVGAIGVESFRRLATPGEIASGTVIIVAGIGILVNGGTALLFAAGRHRDLNLRGAFLHMAYDALISAGVVVTGLGIRITGWTWLDPIVGLLIAGAILYGSWGLLRDSLGMSLDAVPGNLRFADVRRFLLDRAGVSEIHDLHIWPLSTRETALTCHCVMPAGHPGDGFLVDLARDLRYHFRIDHATIQIEIHADIPCALEADHVV